MPQNSKISYSLHQQGFLEPLLRMGFAQKFNGFDLPTTSFSDYNCFGMQIEERTYSESVSSKYPFGMNGQMKDDEIYGEGNAYSAQYWEYDARLGRRWNIDQVKKHHESSYATFANNPIWFGDPNGKDSIIMNVSPVVKDEYYTNLRVVTFSYIQNGVETALFTSLGTTFFLIGNPEAEQEGGNGLPQEYYKLDINRRMNNHKNWYESIHIKEFKNGSSMYIHRGRHSGDIGGCKILTTEITFDENGVMNTPLQSSINAPMAFKDLYKQYSANLTGDKVLMRTNSYGVDMSVQTNLQSKGFSFPTNQNIGGTTNISVQPKPIESSTSKPSLIQRIFK